MAPYYHMHHYIDPALGEYYYLTRVHIRDEDGFRGKRTISAHDSTTPFTTCSAAVSSAARRALWSLCQARRQDLQATKYHHLPRHTIWTEETVVTLRDEGEDRVNVLV